MVRRSLIAAALLAAASPLAAQSPVGEPTEWQWTSNRPDAVAPIGVYGAQNLERGQFDLSFRYQQTNGKGIFFRTDSLSLTDVANLYDDVPLTRRDVRYKLRFGWGLSQTITLLARGEFATIERETFANGAPMRIGIEELGDVEVDLLFRVYDGGPYRLNVMVGGVIPTGKAATYADTTRAQSGAVQTVLPYDMRPGGGTFGVVLGTSGNVQNEFGSLGAQFRMRTNFGLNGMSSVGGTWGGFDNDTGYRLGNEYQADFWGAYKFNSVLSASAGIRWERWRPLEGRDDRLYRFGDPHNAAAVISGQRAHMPLGLNIMMPENSALHGHRFAVEAVYTLHHDYDAPQMGLEWGFNFGWTVAF